jgi:uncharacterized protein YkwD
MRLPSAITVLSASATLSFAFVGVCLSQTPEAPRPPEAAPLAACADERLSEAAASFLATGAGQVAQLDSAAREARSNAVSLRMVRAAPRSTELATLASEAASREAELVVCGEAESDDVVVRIVGREGARISAALSDEGLVLDIALAPGLGRPTLAVRAADGTAFTRELSRRDSRVALPAGFPETFVAQVLASGESGPRPVGELRFGAAPAPEPTSAAAEDPRTHVAQLRRATGAPALRPNALLDSVAAAHAVAICAAGRAVHDLGGAGPVERLRRAGIEARSVGEVVARAGSRAEGLGSLDASPSHRIALEDANYTDAGFGEATAPDGHVCTVVLLAAWPRFAGR